MFGYVVNTFVVVLAFSMDWQCTRMYHVVKYIQKNLIFQPHKVSANSVIKKMTQNG